MKVSEKDVRYVEDLANLELTEAERARMVKDLNSVLDYIDRLNQLDTTNVAPMAQVSDRYGDSAKTGKARFEHAMRADVVGKSLGREAALANAPETDGVFFKVPKVIER
ncbi:MAG TPA: Asp-tRNA(Asn)/Glu-tRNA(Gln) amidotransferase subunit GatC [Terriglobales bacterium]|nr:Asp-tRNA(Asn)/Glu-tRNA(Gln) amidotransferase subunit GatC [Terriglobales bacterium]